MASERGDAVEPLLLHEPPNKKPKPGPDEETAAATTATPVLTLGSEGWEDHEGDGCAPAAVAADDSGCNEDSMERAMGITQFVTPGGPRLAGVLKSRYADFVVHEVAPSGEVVHLRSIATAAAPKAPPAEAATELTVEQQLAELVGEEQARLFAAFAAADAPQSFTFAAEEDRAKRTAVHTLIKKHFLALDTSTEAKRIVATRGKREVRDRSWPKGRPKYLQFTLYKENMDTAFAVQMISRRLGLRPDNISNAGNKDKRAITTQRMTALRVDADKLAGINGRINGVIVGDCSYVDKPMLLGDLYGNRFELAVRDIGPVPEAVVASSVAALQEKGFVNYFGLQRFGTGTVHTHEIGIALLRQDWETAAKLIMNPHNRSSAEAVASRELFLKGDLEGCAAALPRGLHIEATLVKGLLKYGPTAFREAIDCIPRTTRLLYLHAYQSYVWNHMASKRLELYGSEPAVGDLVLVGEDAVRTLSEDDVQSGRYTMFDVVLPMPGIKTEYPANALGDEYDRMLAQDGLSRKSIMQQSTGIYSLPGGYRPVIAKPENVEWRLVSYTDPTQPLITTDADRVRGVAPPTVQDAAAADSTPDTKRALLIAFTLRSSCYATMCYRELLKQHTSAQYQTALEHRTASSSK